MINLFRKVGQKIFGTKSRIYETGEHVLDAFHTVKKEGWGKWKEIRKLKESKDEKKKLKSLELKSLNNSIFVRPGTADIRVVLNNVIREQYGKIKFKNKPKVIVDAGAYIGDTSAYFLSKFESARVVSLEPDIRNYKIAKRNLNPYEDRVKLLNKGLYSEEAMMGISGEGTGVSLSEEGSDVECLSMKELMSELSTNRVDLLKMDIEGAEKDIFSSKNLEWINKVHNLIVEVHDKNFEKDLVKLLSKKSYNLRKHRSVLYFTKK